MQIRREWLKQKSEVTGFMINSQGSVRAFQKSFTTMSLEKLCVLAGDIAACLAQQVNINLLNKVPNVQACFRMKLQQPR